MAKPSIGAWGDGNLATRANDFGAARSWYEQGLKIARESDNQRLLALIFNNIGEITQAEGDYARAGEFYEKAVEEFKRGNQMGLSIALSVALSNLGAIAHQQSDYIKARACYSEALANAREFGSQKAMIYCLDGFAALAISEGRPKVSAQLCGAADALRESIGIQPEPPERKRRDQCIARIEASLSKSAFLEAMAEGRTMSLNEALGLVSNRL
jgi:tetratricopeptide (TPR) repeat protein